jgi:hypothetical protein
MYGTTLMSAFSFFLLPILYIKVLL